MLIRSQDKEKLVNMDRMSVIAIFDTYDVGSGAFGIFAFATDDMDYNDGCLLGRYTTKDKAKNVLDMITEANRKDRQLVPVTVEAGQTNITQFAIFEPQTFQMPPDEEVTE